MLFLPDVAEKLSDEKIEFYIYGINLIHEKFKEVKGREPNEQEIEISIPFNYGRFIFESLKLLKQKLNQANDSVTSSGQNEEIKIINELFSKINANDNEINANDNEINANDNEINDDLKFLINVLYMTCDLMFQYHLSNIKRLAKNGDTLEFKTHVDAALLWLRLSPVYESQYLILKQDLEIIATTINNEDSKKNTIIEADEVDKDKRTLELQLRSQWSEFQEHLKEKYNNEEEAAEKRRKQQRRALRKQRKNTEEHTHTQEDQNKKSKKLTKKSQPPNTNLDISNIFSLSFSKNSNFDYVKKKIQEARDSKYTQNLALFESLINNSNNSQITSTSSHPPCIKRTSSAILGPQKTTNATNGTSRRRGATINVAGIEKNAVLHGNCSQEELARPKTTKGLEIKEEESNVSALNPLSLSKNDLAAADPMLNFLAEEGEPEQQNSATTKTETQFEASSVTAEAVAETTQLSVGTSKTKYKIKEIPFIETTTSTKITPKSAVHDGKESNPNMALIVKPPEPFKFLTDVFSVSQYTPPASQKESETPEVDEFASPSLPGAQPQITSNQEEKQSIGKGSETMLSPSLPNTEEKDEFAEPDQAFTKKGVKTDQAQEGNLQAQNLGSSSQSIVPIKIIDTSQPITPSEANESQAEQIQPLSPNTEEKDEFAKIDQSSIKNDIEIDQEKKENLQTQNPGSSSQSIVPIKIIDTSQPITPSEANESQAEQIQPLSPNTEEKNPKSTSAIKDIDIASQLIAKYFNNTQNKKEPRLTKIVPQKDFFKLNEPADLNWEEKLQILNQIFESIHKNQSRQYFKFSARFWHSHNQNLSDAQIKDISVLKRLAADIAIEALQSGKQLTADNVIRPAKGLIQFNTTRYQAFVKEEKNWFLSKYTHTEILIREADKKRNAKPGCLSF